MDKQLSSSLSVSNWRKYAKDTNGETCGAFNAASRVEDLLDFALERAERSVLQLKTDKATVHCTGKIFEKNSTVSKIGKNHAIGSSCKSSVTRLDPSLSSSSMCKSSSKVWNSVVSEMPSYNKKKVFQCPVIPWKAINRETQQIDSEDDHVPENHIFHTPYQIVASRTSSVRSTNSESTPTEQSMSKRKKDKLDSNRKLHSVQETESSVTLSRVSSSAFTPLSTSALSSSSASPSRQSTRFSGDSRQVGGASDFQSAHSMLQPVQVLSNQNDQGFWFNFNVMVKDPRDGTVRPMHFVADCTNFEVKEMFVNGKRLG